MKNLYIYSILMLLFSAGCSSSHNLRQTDAESLNRKLLSYQNEITPDYLRQQLSVISADSMKGREIGKSGQHQAARYLARQYRKMGLNPGTKSGSFFQSLDLTATQLDSAIYRVFSTQTGDTVLFNRSKSDSQFIAPFTNLYGGTVSLEGSIVFAGFGVNDPDHGVYHLSDMDLKDKWILVFADIPHVINGDTLINPEVENHYRFNTILNQKEAAGIILIGDPDSEHYYQIAELQSNRYKKPHRVHLTYLEGEQNTFNHELLMIDPAFAAQLLGLRNGADGIRELKKSLIASIRGFRPQKLDYFLESSPYKHETHISSENVLAYIEGGDPILKDEVVILSAHYDHLGIGRPDSTGDRIYNGADDDGSGTVALLNIARAFRQAQKKGVGPRRSILFLHVTGEEKGLLGSRYYSDHPSIPIHNTVADLNIDMIGRIDTTHQKAGEENYAYIIGSELISSELDSILSVANSESGQITLDKTYNDFNDPNQFYRRSDHWNFGRKDVPFAFFFTGVHKDYHRPSDEIDKIRFGKMTRIVRTIYATAIHLANSDERPKVDNQAFIEMTRMKTR